MKTLIIALLFAAHAHAAPTDDLPPRFLEALQQQEVGDGSRGLVGDHGMALGVYQIHPAYFSEARAYDLKKGGQFGTYGRWEDLLKDPVLSRRIVTAWMHKNMAESLAAGRFSRMFQAHNGGAGIFRRERSTTPKDVAAVARAKAYAAHAMQLMK